MANEAEASVLGCLLIEPEELAGQIFERVQPEDFGASQLRTLFRTARELWLEQKPVDPVTVLSRAGEEYAETVRSAMTLVPSCAHWEAYCEEVANGAQLRAIQKTAARILEAANVEDAREALRDAQGLLAPHQKKLMFSWEEMIMGFMDRLAAEPVEYLDWSIPALNEQLQVRLGKFGIIAAESSVGKTALALQMAFGLASKGKRVGFFSLETPQADAADRMVAQQARLRLTDIKRRALKTYEIRESTDLAQETLTIPFSLIEAAGFGPEDIRAYTVAQNFEVIFIDYVQLVSSGRDEPYEQVRATSMALHTMCQQLGVTVIALSQVTPPPKNKVGKRPELSKENLRESRQLIHDADFILIMDLEDLKDPKSKRILKLDKNKDGPRARMLLEFDAPKLRFEYVSEAPAPAEPAAAPPPMFQEMDGKGEDLPF